MPVAQPHRKPVLFRLIPVKLIKYVMKLQTLRQHTYITFFGFLDDTVRFTCPFRILLVPFASLPNTAALNPFPSFPT